MNKVESRGKHLASTPGLHKIIRKLVYTHRNSTRDPKIWETQGEGWRLS